MTSSFTALSSRCSLSRRRSSRASISWLTSDAAVVNATVNFFWQAARPSASAIWVLPVPLLPSARMFSRRRIYSQRASSRTSILLRLGDRGEVERVEALGHREPCGADAPFDRPSLAIDQFEFEQPQQVTRMIDAARGALAGDFVILAQHRRQLQLFEMMRQQELGGATHGAGRHRIDGARGNAASTA